jgi:hypothetical protein
MKLNSSLPYTEYVCQCQYLGHVFSRLLEISVANLQFDAFLASKSVFVDCWRRA